MEGAESVLNDSEMKFEAWPTQKVFMAARALTGMRPHYQQWKRKCWVKGTVVGMWKI